MTTESSNKNFMSGKHWIIAIIIIVAGYQVVTGIEDLNKSRKEKEIWTTEDHNILVKRCIQDTGQRGKDFPELTKEYCNCSMKSITAKITKKTYLKIVKKPIEVQFKELYPIFKNCLDDYLAKVTELENQTR